MLEHCGLNGYLSNGVVGLVYVGCEEFGSLVVLLYAVNPNLKVSVVVCKDFVRIIVYNWLETCSGLLR